MSIDPRVALQSLVTALEEHLSASAARRREDDPAVEAAYQGIADAFEVYEEALYDSFEEVTPLELYDDSDEGIEEDDDSDDSDEGIEEDDDDSDDDDDAVDGETRR